MGWFDSQKKKQKLKKIDEDEDVDVVDLYLPLKTAAGFQLNGFIFVEPVKKAILEKQKTESVFFIWTTPTWAFWYSAFHFEHFEVKSRDGLSIFPFKPVSLRALKSADEFLRRLVVDSLVYGSLGEPVACRENPARVEIMAEIFSRIRALTAVKISHRSRF